ncbi:MAG: 2-oxoacid:ferredoxin oxidoreductase subunit beta [Bacteroidetes bacterium GWF2_38_335]|nr:MAG: 2-oxoacid:ferredoxin oxidoreductase subunit beta [Bacteroidetes bacterium GWF2_38_335]OFY80506.1 MAG: 2-oxoacid:ferredoxin oxidoreductase subunit beta [Bacteroidetes bacterium RIFOXYA12_FULL_38_20]HBS85885.1 2-oxoacid:ferredoxin oxidoreductase subunit beta [Bacteroidales bacterium]
MENEVKVEGLSKKDFTVTNPVKWCAGCGGFSILSSVQAALPEVTEKKENVVFVSGIGCSSRFPYYINTYGFHSLHGRAMAIASGIKTANPKLDVWMVTGDGDSMAIGGNHFIHLIRRNININLLLFNNKIYGLTKGQYSPTTPKGSKTKTSPEGTIEDPFNPGELTLGAQGTFFARVLDTDPKMMKEVFLQAAKHKGTSIVEILQNCVIFNNQVHADITGKEVKDEHTIYLEHGKPMIFGNERDKGIMMGKNFKLEVVKLGENGITEKDLMIHDAYNPDPTIHFMLTRLARPEFPMALGVIRQFELEPYEILLEQQVKSAMAATKIKTMDDLLCSPGVFEI